MSCLLAHVLSIGAWCAQCVKSHIFVQKLQILEKLLKLSIFIFVSKLTIFNSKKFEIFEFFVPKFNDILEF